MDAKALTGAFTGKHKGIFIGGAVAVAALAYFMRNKGTAATTETYAQTYPTDTGSVGGAGGASSGGITSDQLVSALDANSKSFNAQLDTSNKTFDAQLAQEKQAREDYQNGLLSAVNNQNAALDDQLNQEKQSRLDYQNGLTSAITSLSSTLSANSKTFSDQLIQEQHARQDYQNSLLSAVNNLSSTFNDKYASLNTSIAGIQETQSHQTEPVYTSSPATGGFNQPAAAVGSGSSQPAITMGAGLVSQFYNAPVTTPAVNTTTKYATDALGFSGDTGAKNKNADAAYMANPTKANQDAAEAAFIAAAQARDEKAAQAAASKKKAG